MKWTEYLAPAAYLSLVLPIVGIAIGNIALMGAVTVGVVIGALGLLHYAKVIK
jgi:hypothetical protein